jgi:hypothetical protein
MYSSIYINMYCRDRNKNCIGRRVSGFELCVWIYVFTSHGGGALRYEGTILKVTEPLASLWNTSHEKSLAFYLSCLQRAALKGEMPLLKWGY